MPQQQPVPAKAAQPAQPARPAAVKLEMSQQVEYPPSVPEPVPRLTLGALLAPLEWVR